ncbi:hypothetical protein RGUI_4316 (plasmid) [Rhodovulum sp. P5]|nr:hypothetical protein RGUI_4316 [Rhodovulum sp. P5]
MVWVLERAYGLGRGAAGSPLVTFDRTAACLCGVDLLGC